MCSFHLRNFPESEFNSRPPVVLIQGPFWDWVSPAPAWGAEVLCSTFHQFCVAVSLLTDVFYSVSFLVGDFLIQVSVHLHGTAGIVWFWEKTPPLKRDTQVRFSKNPFLYILILFPFLFPLTFCSPEHNWMDWIWLLLCSLGSQ